MTKNQSRSYEIDMCSGPILSKVLRFAVPLMFSSMLQLLFNAADIIVVGRYAGDNALAAVGMTEFTRHAPHLLSGGQKQRVAIAGVIAMEPECIVLDEATAMLDPSGRREVLDTVHRLNRERGITVVHITHHMSEAEDADRVIVMNDGVVAMDGAPREIFSRVEELQALGLAAPDTVELLRRLNRHGMDLPLTAITVDECARAIFQALHGAEGK